MAAELQPPEGPIAAVTPASAANSAADAAVATTVPPSTEISGPPISRKRQRRPSVRLGEIGDQPATLSYDYHVRRTKHPWRLPKDLSNKKTRPLTNLVNGNSDFPETLDNNTEDNTHNSDANFEFWNRKSKAKRAATKRVRSNWVSKLDGSGGAEGDSREDNNNEGFRDFDPESDSLLKDQSPINSVGDVEPDLWHGQRMPENDAVELGNVPETDSGDRRGGGRDGVRSWLIELGLSRYAPVFEINEVDDDVLPMLTLEDLKDMGINAVGSRRKLYAAIQKLRRGF